MAGFITDYLPRDGVDDWVCVEDFCGRCDRAPALTEQRGNWCAWWSPSRAVTKFGGDWIGVPDMPSKTQPSEEAVEFWAMNAPTHYARAWRANNWRLKVQEEEKRAIERYYKEHGYNYAYVMIRHPDGSILEQSSCVGMRGAVKVMRDIRGSLERLGWGSSVIAKLKVETGLTSEECERRNKLWRRKKAA